jgi:Raf kinase inhibitor-like YbhB/YbcL family protein
MRARLAAGLVVVAMLAGACAGGGGGASLATSATPVASSPATVGASGTSATDAPTAGATAISSAESTPSAVPTALPRFLLTSTAFAARSEIPTRYTCDGADVSPPLAWSGAPAGTASLVLIVHDPDAGFLHWLAYDIPGTPSGSLPEAIPRSAPSPVQGRNDFGKVGYGGPCPPHGAAAHHYVFGLWAVSRTLGLNGGKTAAEVEAAMGGDILATTELVGLYKRH